MMSLFGYFTRVIFICTIINALTHNAAVGAASSADANSDDTSSMKSCGKLAPLWISTPYNASVIYANGDTKSHTGLQANLTITSQAGCKAIAINSWTNGMIGGDELVAVAIVPPYDDGNENETQLIIMEIGEPPVEGTSAYISATLNDDTTGTTTMHWVYEGRSVNFNDTEDFLSYGTVFEATFYEGSVPEIIDDIPDGEEGSNCVDISGIWMSDAYEYVRLYVSDGHNEIVGPTQNVLNLTQNGCEILGTMQWDNGAMTGSDQIAGVVTGSIVTMFEVYQVTNADQNFNAFVDDDGNMFVHAIGHAFPLGYIVASNIILGRGDTAPNVDIPGCDTNLVGTWKSIDDIDIDIIHDSNNQVSTTTTLSDTLFTIDGQSESGCEFWGTLGDLLKFGGVVESNGKDLLLAYEADELFGVAVTVAGISHFGVSLARIMPNSDDSNRDRIAITYLSRSEDAYSNMYFNALFERVSTYTPVPPVIVINSTTDATFDDSSGATSTLFATLAHYYHHTSFISTIIATASVVTSLFIL